MQTLKVLQVAVLIATGVACAPAGERSSGAVEGTAASSAATATKQEELIDHLLPKRDSTGAPPARFEWTKIEHADRYVIGVWNDVDRLMWRRDDVTTTSVDRPEQLQLDFGTYYWSVVAIQNDQPIAQSGIAAFVVLQ